MEDLWAFNETVVAEAIVQSKIPVISAVGHETRFYHCGFCGGFACANAFAAAELAVPEMDAVYEAVRLESRRMKRALQSRVERMRANVKLFASAKAFRLLENRLMSERQSLDNTRELASRGAKERIMRARAELNQLR
jgi:exodeoxyribonuclease VII large subunit